MQLCRELTLYRGAFVLDAEPRHPRWQTSPEINAPYRNGRGDFLLRAHCAPILTPPQLALAAQRARRAQSIDTTYISRGDAFLGNELYRKRGYTKQVPAPPIHKVFAEMQHQAHEGQIQVDTMILLDVSASMGWDHYGFDQPRHISQSVPKLPFPITKILRRRRAQHPAQGHQPHGDTRPVPGPERPPRGRDGHVQLLRDAARKDRPPKLRAALGYHPRSGLQW